MATLVETDIEFWKKRITPDLDEMIRQFVSLEKVSDSGFSKHRLTAFMKAILSEPRFKR